MEPVISVVIPVYNAETTLRKCVESLVFGTFRSVRIVLVDDCSKDNSWELCQALSKQFDNVICVQNTENKGVSYTRNHGLAETEGEYILFVDSDDWVSGRYAETLYKEALKDPTVLPLCGFKLIDKTKGERKDYLWNTDEESGGRYSVNQKDFFKLIDKVHIQQLWNKVFRKEIIDQYHIRFDEDQSMGEDFQFVLDYMEAAQVKKCVIVNEPLYYYVRANKTSLMSRFGLTKIKTEYNRLNQLLRISGENDSSVLREYHEAVNNSKAASVYQAVHCDSWSKKEKEAFIEQIMEDGKAKQHYHEQNIVYQKEKLAEKLNKAKQLIPRLKGKVRRLKRDRLIARMRMELHNTEFSILSQNCIGGVFYHDMGLQFTSPTINLYLTCPDFVKLVLNLDHYLEQKLRMTWGEEYPIGYLEDVAVFFQHYESCTEAAEKWEVRKKRVEADKIVVLCTDMEEFSDECFDRWNSIPYPKVLFSSVEKYSSDAVFYPEYKARGKVDDLIPGRKFYKDGILLELLNNLKNTK